MTKLINIEKHKHLASLGEIIVVDCGHIPISYSPKYHKQPPSPSKGHIKSLKDGLAVREALLKLDKKVILNICLTDTSKYLPNNISRKKVKEDLFTYGIKILPLEFQAILSEITLTTTNFSIGLQTVNSNLFSNLIKKTKKFVKNHTPSEVYEKYSALFLTDSQRFSFMFSSHFLLLKSDINQMLGGNWWQNPNIHLTSNEVLKCPDIRLKRLGVIKLYDKNKGILCPATYGGLIEMYDDQYDHIAIYSREDDEYIGEKIIRGIIAKEILSPSNKKKYYQYIYNTDFDCYEFSKYDSSKDIKVAGDLKTLMEFTNTLKQDYNYTIYHDIS